MGELCLEWTGIVEKIQPLSSPDMFAKFSNNKKFTHFLVTTSKNTEWDDLKNEIKLQINFDLPPPFEVTLERNKSQLGPKKKTTIDLIWLYKINEFEKNANNKKTQDNQQCLN